MLCIEPTRGAIANEVFFRSLSENTDDLIAAFDENGDFRYVSPHPAAARFAIRRSPRAQRDMTFTDLGDVEAAAPDLRTVTTAWCDSRD